MEIMRTVAHSLQRLFGDQLEKLGTRTQVIIRRRQFNAVTLLRTLVVTVLKHPQAKPADFQNTADQLGVHVSKAAIRNRFSDPLLVFLQAVLERALTMAVAVDQKSRNLLAGFTAVLVGDGTTLVLPDAYAEQFPGCGGTAATGRAAMKIQLLWNYLNGALGQLRIEAGKSSDGLSPIASADVPVGSLCVFDLGYFCLDRFGRLIDRGVFWISRLQINTKVYDTEGRELELLDELQKRLGAGQRIIDMAVALGVPHRLPCRLIAVRIPQEEIARRRQRAYEKAAKHGRSPSAEYLRWQEWTIFVTNCEEERLSWKAVVILYRARWQIELMFKLWKSHNGLDKHREGATAQEQLATVYAKLIGILVQHWLLVSCTWNRACRSLMKAARCLREWITTLVEALEDSRKLLRVLSRLAATLENRCVERRRKNPSLFQLLADPELLDWKC